MRDYYRVKVALKITAHGHADALAKVEARLTGDAEDEKHDPFGLRIIEATAQAWKEPK